jgi:hypothetical protein
VSTLQARVLARARRGNDASEAELAVLAQQLRSAEPLDTDAPLSRIPYEDRWRTLLQRIDAIDSADHCH